MWTTEGRLMGAFVSLVTAIAVAAAATVIVVALVGIIFILAGDDGGI